MPVKSNNTKFFSRILVEQPANNAPYLTKAGYICLAATSAAGISAVVALCLDHPDLVAFLAAFTATAALIIAFVYGIMLLTWRACLVGRVYVESRIEAQKLAPNDKFNLMCTVHNRLPWFLCTEAMRLNVTPCLETLNDEQMSGAAYIRPNSNAIYRFSIKALGVGHAAVLGQAMLLTDPMRLFRAEIHTENDFEISIAPPKPASVERADNLSGAMYKYVTPNVPYRCDDFEAQELRNWRTGDAMRHIFWRGYARRQELMVWDPTPRQQNSLLCLIDAGPHMRLVTTIQGFVNPLIQIVERISKSARDFESITLFAYDEYGATNIVRNAQPDTAMHKLESWLLDTLRYRIPLEQNEDDLRQLTIAATQMNQSFRLYKGIDFRRNSPEGTKIDLRGMVQWARADLMNQAIQAKDDAKAEQISEIPYAELLEMLLQYWYREPMTVLPPNPPVSKFDEIILPLVREIQTGNATLLMWFSDFAQSIDPEALRKLSDAIYHAHLPSIGVQMNMPLHSLNFIASKGSLTQRANCEKLSSVMDFVKGFG